MLKETASDADTKSSSISTADFVPSAIGMKIATVPWTMKKSPGMVLTGGVHNVASKKHQTLKRSILSGSLNGINRHADLTVKSANACTMNRRKERRRSRKHLRMYKSLASELGVRKRSQNANQRILLLFGTSAKMLF